MTEEATTGQLMLQTEFEECHFRTGQHIARVGKLWEAIAEEQQAIIQGKGYTHLGYGTWVEYWNTEWKESSGWAAQTVSNWIKARNVKLGTPLGDVAQRQPSGATA